MNSITVFLLLFAVIALKLRAVQTSTVDVSNTRPALIWYVNKTQQNMFYYQNNNKSWYQCYDDSLFTSQTADFQHGYTSDLQGVYDLREIIVFMSAANVASFNASSLHIYIDRTKCDDFKIKTSSHLLISVTLKCAKKRGRAVTVLSWSRSICNLQVLACGSGVTGENCDRACSGRYGISCSLPCRCSGNGYCDRHTGSCAHGCANSGGNRQNDCFFKSIEMNSRSFYTDFSKGARTVMTSHPYTGNTKSCYSVQFSKIPEGRLFWIEWKFTALKTLKAIEFDVHNNRSIGSAVLGVTVDSVSCLVESVHNSSMSRRRQCNNVNLRGRSVRLTISTKGDSSNSTGNPLPSICDVKLLGCHSGYYGPACRMPCNCLILPCHPETGLCTDDKCIPGYKGRNCAQVDLAKMDDVFTTEESGTIESLPTLFPLGPVPYDMNLFNPNPLWTTVKAVELPGTFRVNHVTVTLHPSVASTVSNISVYMDTEPADSVHSQKVKPKLAGLPCMESYPFAFTPDSSARNLVTTILKCRGFASVLTAVVIGATPMSDDAIHDVGIWTCVDGTFGHRCDRVCNCQQPWDVCDVDTGKCLDSCPSTHGGASCQRMICPPERCILSCPDDLNGCHKTCISGWIGANCESPCPDGFYGDGCLKTCGWCMRAASDGNTCDARTGVCLHGCQSSHPLCYDYKRAVLSGSQPRPSEHPPETGITSKTSTIALLSILTVCLLVFVLVACLGKKHSLAVSSDDSRSKVADHILPFNTIHEGWQWVESMNRMRGYDISCDTCSTGDLTHIQKVAIWILCQEFEDGIIRRKKKLEISVGSVSDTAASRSSMPLDEELEDFDGIA